MRHAMIITTMLLVALSSSCITNAKGCISEAIIENQNSTGTDFEKIILFIKNNHTKLAEDTSRLELTLQLWHEENNYDKDLWHKLAHIFLNLSLMHDSQNLKSICPFFDSEPYQTILSNYTGGRNGIYSGLEIKGDYTNAISSTVFSMPAPSCHCDKHCHENYPGIKCTCQLFQRIKDGETIYYDDVLWQKIVEAFIVYMDEKYTQMFNGTLTLDMLFKNIEPQLKEAILQIYEESGIHCHFKATISDDEADLSLKYNLPKNDSEVAENIFKSTKFLNLDCGTL